MPHPGATVRRRLPFASGASHRRISVLQGGEYVKQETDWVTSGSPYTTEAFRLFSANRDMIAFGFDLSYEGNRAIRIRQTSAMSKLHEDGFITWARISCPEDLVFLLERVMETADCCNHFEATISEIKRIPDKELELFIRNIGGIAAKHGRTVRLNLSDAWGKRHTIPECFVVGSWRLIGG